MSRSMTFWILAFALTLGSAIYQRMTGPTYPIGGTTTMRGARIDYTFERSHGGADDAVVSVPVRDTSVHPVLEWKRFKTDDAFTRTVMRVDARGASATLPHQPAGGKVQYRVLLDDGVESIALPENGYVVMRFKGDVPSAVLIPHILAMFLAMLFSARAGFEVFARSPKFGRLIGWTLGFLIAGGAILGPLVQWYAFHAWWTGWPFGGDLTDNKTAVALVAWIVAAVALKRSTGPRWWVLGASIVTLLVFLIPHSLLGTELDYKAMPEESNRSFGTHISSQNRGFCALSEERKKRILGEIGSCT
ncbi:MAG TPA: hypothetical protein VMG34_00755 [Bacteroidota bacterium]|nr:hypothetical protein [Bacteroidota bacterium]